MPTGVIALIDRNDGGRKELSFARMMKFNQNENEQRRFFSS